MLSNSEISHEKTVVRRRRKHPETCEIPGCNRRYCSRGMCTMHYQRLKNWGHIGSAKPMLADDGEPFKWLENHKNYSGDDCLKWPFAEDGYGRGSLGVGGKTTRAHRVMCELIYGSPPTPAYHAAHNCGKGHLGCVNPRHLEWKTCAENQEDKRTHGTLLQGEDIWASKLTRKEVLEIRSDWNSTGKEISERYSMSQAQISQIRNRHSWSWL
jgi:hypothetical protein